MEWYESISHVRLNFNTWGSSYDPKQNIDVEFLDGPLEGVTVTISVDRDNIREDHREERSEKP